MPSSPASRPEIQPFGTLHTRLGECPVWDAARQWLWLIDSRDGLLLALDAQGQEQQRLELPAPLGSFALNHDGRLVVALRESVVLLDPASGRMQTLGRLQEQHPQLRLNDGAALADGRFCVGTMHTLRAPGEAPLGGLYLIDTAGRMERVDQGYGVVNGPVQHPVDGRVFVSDSAARRIHVYPAPGDAPWRRAPFADTQRLGSAPDGACFDDQGGLWSVMVHTGEIVRFDAQGQPGQRLRVPLAHPSSLCFGGPALDELYVTSISDSGRLSASGPLDGRVLRVRGLGRRGAPRPRCAIQPPT
ncbi:SMP-30/gluconolactonase/LRE family protein [Comamonas antarctica]|uniref:SMP-30/gluconolactonase/LRE family protein n=1 Tax=Comamonas antarctica TaxID=2743470 RepID=A0A6N1X5D3_9BURK|nr:SMP-30/gluconolactonase/LRE family protein [Comamonas antarctica]QKV54561.1 SMP-30/gluconolactonase/LRE family protein [Comamonas antarctica]